MPSTPASFGSRRRMTSVAGYVRVRERLQVDQDAAAVERDRSVPSIPMNDERLSTAGSSRITRASARWRSAIAANEIDCGASEMPRIAPGVLHREEALRDDDVEEDREGEHADRHEQRRPLVRRAPSGASARSRAIVRSQHALRRASRSGPAAPAACAEEPGAHHGRQRERRRRPR